ncbi:MAG: tetratricopeptide repeat protein [Beijerinckiaceae bacterium]
MSHPRAIILAAALLATGAPASAEEDLPRPARPGDVLRIPGLPPVQMPPGARVFGPNITPNDESGADIPTPPKAPQRADDGLKPDRREARKPPRNPPHSTPTEQAQRASVLDRLFAQLKASSDADGAKGVAEAIQRVWLRSGSDTADVLMSRIIAALAVHDIPTAEKLLDAVVSLQPNWAEAWNKRATVRFMRDDIEGAMNDIEETLRREPRHFGALTGLAAILQKSGFDKRALEAYRRALAIYPEQPEIKKAVEKLQLEVEGRDI